MGRGACGQNAGNMSQTGRYLVDTHVPFGPGPEEVRPLPAKPS
jgi:hypothetical protein